MVRTPRDIRRKIEIQPPLSTAYGIDSWPSPVSQEKMTSELLA